MAFGAVDLYAATPFLIVYEAPISNALTGVAFVVGAFGEKPMLQEIAVRQFDTAPVYILSEEGPDHAKHFFAEVFFGDESFGEGEGGSKKLAEQGAAWVAGTRLTEHAELGNESTEPERESAASAQAGDRQLPETGERGDGDAGAT